MDAMEDYINNAPTLADMVVENCKGNNIPDSPSRKRLGWLRRDRLAWLLVATLILLVGGKAVWGGCQFNRHYSSRGEINRFQVEGTGIQKTQIIPKSCVMDRSILGIKRGSVRHASYQDKSGFAAYIRCHIWNDLALNLGYAWTHGGRHIYRIMRKQNVAGNPLACLSRGIAQITLKANQPFFSCKSTQPHGDQINLFDSVNSHTASYVFEHVSNLNSRHRFFLIWVCDVKSEGALHIGSYLDPRAILDVLVYFHFPHLGLSSVRLSPGFLEGLIGKDAQDNGGEEPGKLNQPHSTLPLVLAWTLTLLGAIVAAYFWWKPNFGWLSIGGFICGLCLFGCGIDLLLLNSFKCSNQALEESGVNRVQGLKAHNEKISSPVVEEDLFSIVIVSTSTERLSAAIPFPAIVGPVRDSKDITVRNLAENIQICLARHKQSYARLRSFPICCIWSAAKWNSRKCRKGSAFLNPRTIFRNRIVCNIQGPEDRNNRHVTCYTKSWGFSGIHKSHVYADGFVGLWFHQAHPLNSDPSPLIHARHVSSTVDCIDSMPIGRVELLSMGNVSNSPGLLGVEQSVAGNFCGTLSGTGAFQRYIIPDEASDYQQQGEAGQPTICPKLLVRYDSLLLRYRGLPVFVRSILTPIFLIAPFALGFAALRIGQRAVEWDGPMSRNAVRLFIFVIITLMGQLATFWVITILR